MYWCSWASLVKWHMATGCPQMSWDIFCTPEHNPVLLTVHCLQDDCIPQWNPLGNFPEFHSPPMMQDPLVAQDFLIIEASRLHSDKPQSIVLLWWSDQPVSETSTWQHTHARAHARTRKRQTSMPLAGLEPPMPRLNRAATGILFHHYMLKIRQPSVYREHIKTVNMFEEQGHRQDICRVVRVTRT